MDTAVASRFYDKVEIDHPSKCWLWTASVNQDGYGHAWDGERVVGAHRLSFSLWHGRPVAPNMQVMHTCDTPPCVNPFHLLEGTHRENMRDRSAKGRRFPARNNLQISDEVAREILRRYLAGEKLVPLATEYDVSNSFISGLKHGKRQLGDT